MRAVVLNQFSKIMESLAARVVLADEATRLCMLAVVGLKGWYTIEALS